MHSVHIHNGLRNVQSRLYCAQLIYLRVSPELTLGGGGGAVMEFKIKLDTLPYELTAF